jgi:hypothetical protein
MEDILKCEKCGIIGFREISNFWELDNNGEKNIYCHRCSIEIEREFIENETTIN